MLWNAVELPNSPGGRGGDDTYQNAKFLKIKKIQTKFKKKLFCVSTGGLSKIISKDINLINTVNENLTIHGLIEIFKLNYNAEINW